MKSNIHPKWYPQAKVFVGGQQVGTIGSTKPEITLDIWSGNHPYWTGQQRIVDTEKLADKFVKKMEQKQSVDELKAKKEKLAARVTKAKEVNTGAKLTLKDMLKNK